jgi:S-formylglutathione hydrolase FrmB
VKLCTPYARAALLLLFFCTACGAPELPQGSVQPVSATSAATITDVRFPSASIGGLLWYRVVVPTVAPGERLPALYLLHGGNGNAANLEQQSEAAKFAVAQRLIVVMPTAYDSYYTNAAHRPHAHWEDAIAFDLARDVEARFPVLPGRQHRGIAGISMGGYGAVKLALKHPELYAFAGTMSGALDITRRPVKLRRVRQAWMIWSIFGLREETRLREDIFELLNRAPDLQSITWFESCGFHDPLEPINARFVRELHARGIPLEGITTPGFHDWQTWSSTMPQLFKAAGEALR